MMMNILIYSLERMQFIAINCLLCKQFAGFMQAEGIIYSKFQAKQEDQNSVVSCVPFLQGHHSLVRALSLHSFSLLVLPSSS